MILSECSENVVTMSAWIAGAWKVGAEVWSRRRRASFGWVVQVVSGVYNEGDRASCSVSGNIVMRMWVR